MRFPSAPADPRLNFGENVISERVVILEDDSAEDISSKYALFARILEELPLHSPEIRETHFALTNSNRYRLLVRFRLYGPADAPTPTAADIPSV